MAEVKVFQCDLCPKGELLSYLTERDVVAITIPGVKIGEHTYRKNDGHACYDCGKKLSDLLGNVLEQVAEIPAAYVKHSEKGEERMGEEMSYRPGRN
jgi:hypothetical protein